MTTTTTTSCGEVCSSLVPYLVRPFSFSLPVSSMISPTLYPLMFHAHSIPPRFTHILSLPTALLLSSQLLLLLPLIFFCHSIHTPFEPATLPSTIVFPFP